MSVYNKLVRDKIPAIIEQSSKIPVTRILNDSEYLRKLEEKLIEETLEYNSSTNRSKKLEELADVLEVIHSLAKALGSSIEELNQLREKKKLERGGFENRILLIEVESK